MTRKMLESVACAFGWINPLLGQMAPSPCRADRPQSAHHPSYIFCVSVFHQKKKKTTRHTGRLALAKMVDGSVLVLEYDGSLPSLPLCLCAHACVCALKIIHEDMPQYLLGKCGLAA